MPFTSFLALPCLTLIPRIPDETFAIALAGDADDRNGQASCYAPGSQEETASLGNSSARFSAIVLDNKQEALERAVHECCVFIVPQVQFFLSAAKAQLI